MKITTEHLAQLRQHIAKHDTPERRQRYANGTFPRAASCKDLNMRYRWDLCNEFVPVKWICDTLYSYMNDDHIDTALRNIIPAIK